MADSSVAITAGSGTPIRVLTALGTASADQQVVTLADQFGNLQPSDPDGTPNVSVDPATLFLDTFDTTLGNWTTGGTAPSISNSLVTFTSNTTASTASYMRTNGTFILNAGAYLRIGASVRLNTTAIANSTRWWGYGSNQTTPSAANPVLNGAVFLLDYVSGQFYAAYFSAGTRTLTATLTMPTDGNLHRYEIWYRQSVIYWVVDGLIVATQTMPTIAVTHNLYAIAGSVNFTTGPSTAPTLVMNGMSVSDTGGNNHTLSDGVLPYLRASVKAASTAVAATDLPLAVGLHPTSPLPTGSNTIGSLTNLASITTGVVPGTGATSLGKARGGTPGTTDTSVAVVGIRAPATPVALNSAGQYIPMLLDSEGKPIMAGQADTPQYWSATRTNTTTSAAQVGPTTTGSIRIYVTSITVSNSSATATLFTLLDNTGTPTTIWQAWLPASMTAPISATFPTALRCTAATALASNLSVAASTVYVAAAGYLGI